MPMNFTEEEISDIRAALAIELHDCGLNRDSIVCTVLLLKNDGQAMLEMLECVMNDHPDQSHVLAAALRITHMIPDKPKNK